MRTRKGRGAILCDTDKGCLIFKEYAGNPEKTKLQKQLLERVSEADFPVERLLLTKEDALFTEDTDGRKYVLKTYFENRECNIRDGEECREAVKTLARLHEKMCFSAKASEEPVSAVPFSLEKEWEKHNRELRKVWRYLKGKSQKSLFETALLKEYDYFLLQAQEILEEFKAFAREDDLEYIKEQGMFCHGDYQYHNIIKQGQGFAVINFERCIMDNQVRDLCLFMRKLLEKNNWSEKLGKSLLEAYNAVRPLSARSFVELYYRLAYPEKFWKIVNFYYNSRKVWIPERNWEKLRILSGQEKEKQAFLDAVFRTIT